MNDGRKRLMEEYPGLRVIDLAAPVTILAASNDGGKVLAIGDDGRLRIRALVSTPRVNSYGFRIDPSAWPEAMPEFMQNPVMMAFHDWSRPIGRWDKWEVTQAGLVMEGWISSSEPGMQQKVLDGTVSRVSIGFWPLSEDRDEDETPVVKKVKLMETSLVPIPADAGTMVEPLAGVGLAEGQGRETVPASPPVAEIPREVQVDMSVVLGAADACRVALGAMDSLGRASRIAAGLRRETIRRGDGDE